MRRKIIIYALGIEFEQKRNLIDWTEVIALADKRVTAVVGVQDIPCIKPYEILKFDYDYIAIFSRSLFDVISKELIGLYNVPKEKIIPWQELIKDDSIAKYDVASLFSEYIRGCGFLKVLDLQMKSIASKYLVQEQFFSQEKGRVDGVNFLDAIKNDSLYSNIYDTIEEIVEDYDVVLWDIDKTEEEKFDFFKERTKQFLFHTTYDYDEERLLTFLTYIKENAWNYKKLHTSDGILWVLEKKQEIAEGIAIYVVSHKEYNIFNDDIYKPICVGEYVKEGYLTERVGDNISYLNRKINECTALYWIWKNTNTKYVGLNHYRRYFYNSSIKCMDNRLSMERSIELLGYYDIILPEVSTQNGISEYQRIRNSIDHKVFDEGYQIIREVIAKHQPKYLVHFDNVMKGYSFFPCNMFVTTRQILNDYCEWLFSFLVEAAEKMDVTGADSYSERVMGFFAERMWTVWLREQKLRIKQLPFDGNIF